MVGALGVLHILSSQKKQKEKKVNAYAIRQQLACAILTAHQ
jgi:hypothetical protein